MTILYDENGLVIQNLNEILDERESACQDFLGSDFTIAGESVVGNLQASDADRELALQEALLYLATQLDPNQAEGIWLDYICALNNIQRYQATKSTIPIKIIGTAGTAKNTGEITIVDETTDEYYTNSSTFIIGEDGTVNTIFTATSFGAITALPSSNFSLKTPSLGISSVEYNSSGEATVGRNVETDEELRARRLDAVTYTASSILSSIKAAVSQVEGVTYLNAYENDTMSEVDTLPAKSFEIVVEGGDDDAIAKAILLKKPAGIQAFGTTTKTVEDSDGNIFNIGFTRPEKVAIDYRLTFTSDDTQTEEWKENLKNELYKGFNNLYNVGDDVYVYNLYCVLNSQPEIKNVTQFQVQKHATDTWSDVVEIGKRELATLSIDDITITQSGI